MSSENVVDASVSSLEALPEGQLSTCADSKLEQWSEPPVAKEEAILARSQVVPDGVSECSEDYEVIGTTKSGCSEESRPQRQEAPFDTKDDALAKESTGYETKDTIPKAPRNGISTEVAREETCSEAAGFRAEECNRKLACESSENSGMTTDEHPSADTCRKSVAENLCRNNGGGIMDIMKKFDDAPKNALHFSSEQQDLLLVTDSSMQLRQGLNACDEFDEILPVLEVTDEKAKEKWQQVRTQLTKMKKTLEKDQLRDIVLRQELEYALETWERMRVKLAPFMSEDKIQFDISEVQQEVEILKRASETLRKKLSEQRTITNEDDSFDWDSLKNLFPGAPMQKQVDENGEELPAQESPDMKNMRLLQEEYEKEKGKFLEKQRMLLADKDEKQSKRDMAASNLQQSKDREAELFASLQQAKTDTAECEINLANAKQNRRKTMTNFNKDLDQKRQDKRDSLEKLKAEHAIDVAKKERQAKKDLEDRQNTLTRRLVGFNGEYESCHLFFVLDCSDSMRMHWQRLRDSVTACIDMRRKMKGNDKVTIITFSHTANTVAAGRSIGPSVFNYFQSDIAALLPESCPGGGTSFAAAFKHAKEEVKESGPGYRPVVIFMTDGYCGDSDVQVAADSAMSMYTRSGNSMLLFGILMSSSYANTLDAALGQVRKIVRAGNGGVTEKSTEAGDIEMLQACAVEALRECFEKIGMDFEHFAASYKKKKRIVKEQIEELRAERKQEAEHFEEECKRQERLLEEEIEMLEKDMLSTDLSKERIVQAFIDAKNKAEKIEAELRRLWSEEKNKRDRMQSDLQKHEDELQRCTEKVATMDTKAVDKAKDAADEAQKHAFAHVMEDLKRDEEQQQKMVANLGTRNADKLQLLGSRLRQIIAFKHTTKAQVKEKEVRLDNVIRYLEDTVNSIENPSCSPLQMSTDDKVALVENFLDGQWQLNLTNRDEQNNMEMIIDHMWPDYSRSSAGREGTDKAFAYAIKVIKGSHLKVKDFFPDDSPTLVAQAKKNQAKRKSTADDNDTPEMRIWTVLVKKEIDRAVSEKFKEFQERLLEKKELQEKFGEKEARDELKEEEADNLKDIDEEFGDQIQELEEELKDGGNELSRDEKSDLKRQIKELKEQKLSKKRDLINNRKESEKRFKELVMELKAVEAERGEFESRLKLNCQRIIDSLKSAILHPYEIFAQKFQKHSVRASLSFGHRGFYTQALAYRYQADQFKIAFTETIRQRSEAIENKDKYAFRIPDSKALVDQAADGSK